LCRRFTTYSIHLLSIGFWFYPHKIVSFVCFGWLLIYSVSSVEFIDYIIPCTQNLRRDALQFPLCHTSFVMFACSISAFICQLFHCLVMYLAIIAIYAVYFRQPVMFFFLYIKEPCFYTEFSMFHEPLSTAICFESFYLGFLGFRPFFLLVKFNL